MIFFFLISSSVFGLNFSNRQTAPSDPFPTSYVHKNDILPRLQWDANFGYCGEVSLISAGLYYGQYCSQFTARDLDKSGLSQCNSQSQLLLGIPNTDSDFNNNAEIAAYNMCLNTEAVAYAPGLAPPGTDGTTQDILVWIKHRVLKGHPVITGVFLNYTSFFNCIPPTITCSCSSGDTDCTCDPSPCSACMECCDPQYDHIVPILGIGSNHPLSDTHTFYSDDVIYFSDNGIWAYPTNPPCYTNVGNRYAAGYPKPYIFSYPFGAFINTRDGANAANGNLYSYYDNANFSPSDPGCANYALAVTGVMDNSDGGPYVQRVRVIPLDGTGSYGAAERPDICDGGNPKCDCLKPIRNQYQYTPVALRVIVSGLTPGVEYNLYQYNDFSYVPTQDFNANSSFADHTWTFTLSSGSTFEVIVELPPDPASDTRAFRCVPNDAT